MEVKLIVVNGKQKGKEIPVAAPKIYIGRGEGCQLRPQSNLVSRKHCAIVLEGDAAIIEDLKSTNGTFVNDERIEGRRELHDGDRIKVGMLDLEVKLIVGAESKSKPNRHSVQETARTVAAVSTDDDDADVSRWLDEDDALKSNPSLKEPAKSDDTIAGKSMIDTATIPIPPAPHKEEPHKKEEKKQAPAKGVGKLHPPAKPTTDSSGEAADDALRHFFQRKKP